MAGTVATPSTIARSTGNPTRMIFLVVVDVAAIVDVAAAFLSTQSVWSGRNEESVVYRQSAAKTSAPNLIRCRVVL